MNFTHLNVYEKHGILTVFAYCLFLGACAFRMTETVAFPHHATINGCAIILEAFTAGIWMMASYRLLRDFAVAHGSPARAESSHSSSLPMVAP